ncbi:hypothetical protein OXPF_13730 [Oxobacter pfennigii]|uniref:Uncharacterized protein n=1 Tax=Oxobacter pfennigii TaxID=36849 RepID=A0A0P8X257_9CLOT|nr:hypothetical protein [Oxobacter pfennigii]KPU44895.1 hypothetical protein OXPF_13730 [Oxobacter pfennigii]
MEENKIANLLEELEIDETFLDSLESRKKFVFDLTLMLIEI